MKGSLFSNYFLEEGIKATEDWKRYSEEELGNIYSKISEVFKSFSKRKRPDEADTEDGLIRPIIELLGFQWSRQKSPSRKGRQDVPDFVLFPDKKSKEDFDKEPSERKPWDKAICILEGKRWKRNLDKGDKTDPIDSRSPFNQILRYLSVAEPASNGKIVWGILTNGEIWRLYYHKAPSRAEGFIEFNLSEVFEEPSLFDNFQNKKEKFKIFYLFFRKEAFIPTDWRPYNTFLEIALEEGKRWEEKVSENLKEKIFYEVFPNIAKGFLIDAKTKGENIDDTILREIYNNTLVLLYRLLFLFYAEDRDLLPIKSETYKNYSLSKIRDEVAAKIDRGETLSETGSFYWDRIKNLFRIINNGDKSLKIPPYNGGLFDPQKHPFLEKFSVPDKFLVPAIDKLSRDYTVNPPKRINYRDLSVRQLGSIYEGLLEFKLKIAETSLGVRKEKGKEVYYPVDNENKAKVKKGELYLTNDKSERKATGSYYTPDYIVQYIVKNSIEPLIQEKLQEFENWKNLLKTKNKGELRKLIKELDVSFDPKLYDSKGRVKGEKNINAYRNALLSERDPAEAILKLKILDPAMGSGHFLVGAVDYLADRILEILAETSDKNYFGREVYRSPLLDKLEDIRNRILEKAQKEDYIIDETKLEDKNLIKRIILKRCIYGVDVNPLAVELAKVSLWLHTFTTGAPLSFLDHHLKCGNSLIGANPEDFDRVFEKSPIFGSRYTGLMNAIEMIEKLEELTDTDISEVEESAKIYDSVIKQLEPYKKLLNVYTADFFLRPKRKSKLKEYQSPLNLLDGIKGDPLHVISGKINLTKEEQNLINTALNLAKIKRFFHWKLEFPEVWYGKGRKKANGGFDVVIGNPPYLVEVRENKDTFRDLQHSATVGKYYEDKMDIFYFFIECGIDLLKEYGFLGFIVQEYWVTRAKATKLRGKIFNETKPVEFVLFKDFKVFKEAPGQHNMILILRKSETNKKDGLKIKILNTENLKELAKKIAGEQKEAVEKVEENIVANELSKEWSKIFRTFHKKLSLVYSSRTDKVYIVSKGLTEKLEMLKANNVDDTFNLEDSEIQQGVVTPQHSLRGSGEGIFVLSQNEVKKYNWTQDEQKLLKPFYYAEQIDRYFYPQFPRNYYLIYTPLETCIQLETYYLSTKIRDLLDTSNAEIKEFMVEFTPHLLKKPKKNLNLDPSLIELLDHLNKKKENIQLTKISSLLDQVNIGNYPNIVKHLLRYKAHITSDHKPFGIHRARQPEWFEDPNKIIGVRKTKYPKFVVVDKPFYMDQSVFIIRLIEHREYSPYYLTALLNSKFGWWWFYNQKRQGEQLQIDKEVLLNFPIPKIDFSNRNENALSKLKLKYEKGKFSDIEGNVKSFPPNSLVLHDFLSFLAKKMTELNQNKYLLKLFIENKIDSGTNEMIKVIKLLETHPEWKDGASGDYKKEIARNLLNKYEEQVKQTDKLIDQIVYHLYGLNSEDIKKIEDFFQNSK